MVPATAADSLNLCKFPSLQIIRILLTDSTEEAGRRRRYRIWPITHVTQGSIVIHAPGTTCPLDEMLTSTML
jgi:hypothetical protein